MCECNNEHLPKSVSRRDILKFGALGAGLYALGPMGKFLPTATAAPLPLKRLVVINLFGGNDTLGMIPPTGLQTYFDRRQGLSLQPANGIDLNVGPGATTKHVLHPAMPKIGALWGEGAVAAINRVGYPSANLSHFESMEINSFGVRRGFGDLGIRQSGWIARFADLYAPTPFGAVSVGVGRPTDFIGGTVASPFLVDRLSRLRFRTGGRNGNDDDAPEHLHRLDVAKRMIDRWSTAGNTGEAKTAIKQAYDLAGQVQTSVANFQTNETYTNERLSRQLKDVATLIQGGFETQIFYTGTSGYDTHGEQGVEVGRHATLLQRVDDAVGAFVNDLKTMNLWNDTVICLITEFGRRNFVNGSIGTDHGHAWCELVLGGAVNGGMYGPDLTDGDLLSSYQSYEVDFRNVYMEILQNHLGVNPNPVLPEPLEKSHVLGII